MNGQFLEFLHSTGPTLMAGTLEPTPIPLPERGAFSQTEHVQHSIQSATRDIDEAHAALFFGVTELRVFPRINAVSHSIERKLDTPL